MVEHDTEDSHQEQPQRERWVARARASSTHFLHDIADQDSFKAVHAADKGAYRSRVIAGLVLLLVLFVAATWSMTYVVAQGRLPAGTTIAGVDVAHLSAAQASDKLHEELDPFISQPVTVVADTAEAVIDPDSSGLTVDWQGTVANVFDHRPGPIKTLSALLFDKTTDFPLSTTIDEEKLASTSAWAARKLSRDPANGSVTIARGEVKVVNATTGIAVTGEQVSAALTSQWLTDPNDRNHVQVAAQLSQPGINQQAVDQAAGLARYATSADLVAEGRGADGYISTAEISDILSFHASANSLDPVIDYGKAGELLGQGLDATQEKPVDAHFATRGSQLVAVNSQAGRVVDWDATFVDFEGRLLHGKEKKWKAVYKEQPAAITDEFLTTMHPTEVMGQFSVATASPQQATEASAIVAAIDGTVIPAGGTFSLNKAAQDVTGTLGGAPDADGRTTFNVVASALFNAGMEAGLTPADRRGLPKSITGVAAGREADWTPGGVNLMLRNPYAYPVVVSASMNNNSVRMGIFGEEKVTADISVTSRRSSERVERIVDTNEACEPRRGEPATTVTANRKVSRTDGSIVVVDSWTTVYPATPTVVCRAPEAEPAPADDAANNQNNNRSPRATTSPSPSTRPSPAPRPRNQRSNQ